MFQVANLFINDRNFLNSKFNFTSKISEGYQLAGWFEKNSVSTLHHLLFFNVTLVQ